MITNEVSIPVEWTKILTQEEVQEIKTLASEEKAVMEIGQQIIQDQGDIYGLIAKEIPEYYEFKYKVGNDPSVDEIQKDRTFKCQLVFEKAKITGHSNIENCKEGDEISESWLQLTPVTGTLFKDPMRPLTEANFGREFIEDSLPVIQIKGKITVNEEEHPYLRKAFTIAVRRFNDHLEELHNKSNKSCCHIL